MISASLESELGGRVTWPAPRGGFFLWVTLPAGIDADAMVPRAVDRGVIYVAGEAFFVDGQGSSLVRLSFSAPTHERIREGVRRFAATVREELDAVTAAASPAESPRPGVR